MQPAPGPLRNHDPVLGAVVSRWKAGWKVRAALFAVAWIFGGIFILVGAANSDVRIIILGIVIGCGLVGLIEFFQSAVQVVVYTNGIERRGRTGSKRVAWPALESYRLNVIDQAAMAGASGGLLGALLAQAFIKMRGNKSIQPRAVILRDTQGVQVVVPDSLQGYEELLATLVPSVTERLFPAAKRAFDANQPVSFGESLTIQRGVGVTVKGLFGKKTTLPMAEFAGASVERARLFLHKKDKRNWHVLQLAAISNPGVLERLIVGRPGEPIDHDGLPMAWTS